jgi:hypothetical protein
LLRLAQNLETPQHKLLNLVCFAQLEWSRVLEAAPNFLQRVNLVYTLSPITVDDLREMIQFRIRQAGADGPRTPEFEDAAIRTIHGYSEGNPRVIVSLCRNSLLLGAQLEQRRITAEMVLHTIEKTMPADAEKLARTRTQAGPAPEEVAPRVHERPVESPQPVGAQAAVAVGARTPVNVKNFSQRANQLLLQASRSRSR